jgi:Flp pilus assembly protein protease CpaA
MNAVLAQQAESIVPLMLRMAMAWQDFATRRIANWLTCAGALGVRPY